MLLGWSILKLLLENLDLFELFFLNFFIDCFFNQSDRILINDFSGSDLFPHFLDMVALIDFLSSSNSFLEDNHSVIYLLRLVLVINFLISLQSSLAVVDVSSSTLNNSKYQNFLSKFSLVLGVLSEIKQFSKVFEFSS